MAQQQSPFTTFNNWLFDGDLYSEIPKPKYDDEGNLIVTDLLKYNSPITFNYLIKLFIKNKELSIYLNKVFNNNGVWYLQKDEFFKFIKKCVIDFKINRNSMMFFKWGKKNILFDKLSEKFPLLKKDDILLICDNVDNHPQKKYIYEFLKIKDNHKKIVIKKKIEKTKKKKKRSLNKFIKDNFIIETTS